MSVSVLLPVDDRPDNLFVLEQVVGAYLPEIKMISAESAEAGLALAATEAIDGALIDVQMPGMNGIEMCRRLKADPRTAPIHVILVTEHGATSELKALGLEAGADDFIAKPIDNVELAAKLRVMLRLRAAEQALRRERHHLEETVLERTQELRDAEYRYRTLFHAAADAVFINDLEGRLLEVNEEACRLLDYTRDELLRLTVSDVTTSEYVARRPEILEQLQATGHLVFENELITRGGRIIPTECSSRLMDLQGRPAVLSITRDITERKAADEALSKNYRELQETAQQLEQSRNMLQLIIESVPVRVFWKDGDLRFMGCNTLFARDAGFSHPQQLLGKDDFAMGWREQADLYRTEDRQVMESRRPKMNIIEPQTTPAGAEIWLSTSKVPLQMPNGEVFGVLGVYEDVTDRKLAEEALHASEERLRLKLDSILSPDVDIVDQDLSNILDIPVVHSLMEDITKLTSMAMAIVDLNGNMLVATGWQDICTQFHRVHPQTARACTESDLFLAQNLQPGEYVAYKCKNHLWDVVTPLFIGGKHVGNIYTGQFFYEDEAVDDGLFIDQAAKYGFDQEAYLSALHRVPRFSLDRVKTLMDFLAGFSGLVSRLSYSNLKLAKAMSEQKQVGEALKESLARTTEVQYGTIEALSTITEARDPYTAGHQRRVTQLACAVARELGLPADRVAGLRVMGLLHDLRHTYASYLLMSGVQLKYVKELLGHKDIKATQIYAHLDRAHLDEALEKLSFKDE
ncbi:MAG: PocR ligand-binding domain-containing protein [Pseudomonadota bacterium]